MNEIFLIKTFPRKIYKPAITSTSHAQERAGTIVGGNAGADYCRKYLVSPKKNGIPNMKRIILSLSLLVSLFIFSCSPPIPTQPEIVVEPSAEPEVEVPASEPTTEETTTSLNLSCTLTADCEAGKQCINGQCGTIEVLYDTNCASKCNFEEIIISTSDGETYTLGKGQGSYTAAGAIEWKLLSVPDYCPMELVVVPLKIIAKNYGKVVGEYALTLQEGETSKQIVHPAIPSLEFTVTVDKVKESCS